MAYISPTNRRFLIAYVLLVGLPLLGLAGVLRTGHRLMAPLSVDGTWKLDIDNGSPSSQPCLKAVASLQDSAMLISQSGKGFVMTFDSGKFSGSGTIEGTTLGAALPVAQTAGESRCGDEGMIILAATIDPHAEPRSMSGTFSVNGCSSCTAVKYHATRQSHTVKKEAH
jgi:hypothetical protein